MTDFFLKSGDDQLAMGAQHLDDIDLIYSKTYTGPWGASLVAVAQKDGVHVCWRCGEQFNETVPKYAPAEVKTGDALILLHKGCVSPTRSSRSFTDIVRGLQARRFVAKAVKPFLGSSSK